MVRSFRQVDDVVEYWSGRIDGKREVLLWPVWAYRVIAPRIIERTVNVLQKAVLGMCRAGENRIKRMDEKFNLGSDLIAHVFNELIMLGLIENDGALTERGHDFYKEDELEDAEQTVGYVFQDPWSGSLWHRFKEDPFSHIIETEKKKNSDGLILKLGSTGNPRPVPAFRVFPPENCVPSTPNSREILFAVQKYNRILKNRRYALKHNNIEPNSNFSEELNGIDKISVIEEEPVPLFLVSAIHLNDKNNQSKAWFAADPFGLGESWDMRMQIETKLQDIPSLQDKISKFVGDEILAGVDKYEQFLRNIEEKAVTNLENMFSKNMYKYPGLFESLLTLQVRYDEYMIRSRPSKKLIRDIMKDASEPIEGIFSHILDRFTITIEEVDKMISDDKDHNRAIFNNIAEAYGYDIPLPNSLIADKSKLIGILRFNNTTMGPLVLINLLSARHLTEHPLMHASGVLPELFDNIGFVKKNRDPNSHFGRDSQDHADIDKLVETTFGVVSVLLEQLEKY